MLVEADKKTVVKCDKHVSVLTLKERNEGYLVQHLIACVIEKKPWWDSEATGSRDKEGKGL